MANTLDALSETPNIIEYEGDKFFTVESEFNLFEQVPDKGWELEEVEKMDNKVLLKLRFVFHDKRQIPIDFQTLRYEIGSWGYSRFQIVQILRRLWRAGIIRRFVRGKWHGSKAARDKGIKYGNWWGVHYIIN